MPNYPVKLILNPNADLGTAWRQASDLRPVVDELGGADWSGTVYPTHAAELAFQAAQEGYERVIAVGGDGTAHEVINGLMRAPPERRPALGVVPMGSGNDFAHNIGVERQPPLAMRNALTNPPRPIDIGLVEDEHGRREYWGNVLGIGFDATVAIRSHRMPFLRGFPMYLTAALQTILLNHVAPRMHFKTDQEEWESERLMLVICNGPREGGGFHVAPEAVPDDGLFHYACVEHVSRLMMLRLIPEVLRGAHGRFRQVRMGTLRQLELQSDRPLMIHTDGEIFAGFGADVRHLKVEVLESALNVVR